MFYRMQYVPFPCPHAKTTKNGLRRNRFFYRNSYMVGFGIISDCYAFPDDRTSGMLASALRESGEK